MKPKINITLACLIAFLVFSSTAFADILTDGDTWVRVAGPGISVDGDWEYSEAHCDAVGDDYYGFGGFRAWNFTYTTETDTFDWYSYLWVLTTVYIDCWGRESYASSYAHAEAIVYGPGEKHLMIKRRNLF